MKDRVLILGDTLAGLVTACRLRNAGFHVTILKTTDNPHESTFPSPPLVFYGSHIHTDLLLQELGLSKQKSYRKRVSLEFKTSSSTLARVLNPPLPAPWHTLWAILSFAAFPYRQRWDLLNYLEKVWEGKTSLPNSLDLQTAASWLTTIGQTVPVQQTVWAPLCKFLLGTNLSETRAGSLATILARVFFQSRHHHPSIPGSPNFLSSLFQNLRKRLEQQEVAFHRTPAIEHLQVSTERISGVCLSDGTIHTADWYVAALHPKALLSMLSERLLARYSFFHQMSQTTFAPIVTFHALWDHKIDKPRFFLHPGNFSWTLCRTARTLRETSTLVSCVAAGDHDLYSQPDDHIKTLALENLNSLFLHLPTWNTESLHGHSIVRELFCFMPHTPGSEPSRPSVQTPIPNLLLAGSWTDTNASTDIESAITSGEMCAQAVIKQNGEHD